VNKHLESEPNIDVWLRSLPASSLVEIIESASRHMPDCQAFVQQMWTQAVRGDLAAGRDALARLSRLKWYDDEPWGYGYGTYDYSNDVEPILAPLLASAEHRPSPQLLPLLEQAITMLAAAFEEVDDSDGELGDLVNQLADALKCTADACVNQMTSNDQIALAEWLWRDAGDVCNYVNADLGVIAFADALGEPGLQQYRTLVDAQPDDTWRVSSARKQLALLDRDVDAIVAAYGGTLDSAGACWSVVAPLVAIERLDLALEYAHSGFAFGPRNAWDSDYDKLADFLVDDALTRGDASHALVLRTQAFWSAPNRGAYDKLRKLALDQSIWDTVQADVEAELARRAPAQWEDELLDQHRIDEAWQFAQNHADACGYGVWERLLAARGRQHPADVLPHYQKLIDHDLINTGRERYESAGKRLILLRGFAEAAGQSDGFEAYLRQLWDGARRRPACREIFTRLGLASA